MLTWIDDYLLSFFTKLSHKFQKLTGKTNYFLARICLIGILVSTVISCLNYWFPLLAEDAYQNIPMAPVIMTPILLITVANQMYKCDEEDKNLLLRSDIKTRPFSEVSTFGSRMFFGILAIFDLLGFYKILFLDESGVLIFKLMHNFFTVYVFFYLYFVIINPLPPGKSKVQEWVESFSAGFRQLAPITRPQR